MGLQCRRPRPGDLQVWKQYTQEYNPEAGVAYIRIKTENWSSGLSGGGAGTTDRVFFDNIEWPTSPTPVTIPGAVLLGAMGLGMVGWMKRRKKEA